MRSVPSPASSPTLPLKCFLFCSAKPECEGKPCGENKCVVVGANKEYACSCSVGYYGEKCDSK